MKLDKLVPKDGRISGGVSTGSSGPKPFSTRRLHRRTRRVGPISSGSRAASAWGNLSQKSVKTAFLDYVSRLKNADSFLRSARSVAYYSSLSKTRKALIRERLKVVDPVGYKKLIGRLLASGSRTQRLQRLLHPVPTNETRTRDLAIVETRLQEQGSVGKVSVVSLEGFKRLLAASLAIYKPEEVAAFAGMELSALNTMVSAEDITVAKKMVPEAIRTLADQRVLKDLSTNNITDHTEMVDRISARRTKLAIEAHKEMRETEKEDDVLQKKREQDIRERFGVNRETGYVEVKP